jgi:hypothetical protein
MIHREVPMSREEYIQTKIHDHKEAC